MCWLIEQWLDIQSKREAIPLWRFPRSRFPHVGSLVTVPSWWFPCCGSFAVDSLKLRALAAIPWRWPPCGVASLQFPRVVYRNAWGEEPHCFYRTAHCLKFKLLRRGFYDSCQAIAFHSVAIFLCLCCWYYAIRSVQKIDEFLFFFFSLFCFSSLYSKGYSDVLPYLVEFSQTLLLFQKIIRDS